MKWSYLLSNKLMHLSFLSEVFFSFSPSGSSSTLNHSVDELVLPFLELPFSSQLAEMERNPWLSEENSGLNWSLEFEIWITTSFLIYVILGIFVYTHVEQTVLHVNCDKGLDLCSNILEYWLGTDTRGVCTCNDNAYDCYSIGYTMQSPSKVINKKL